MQPTEAELAAMKRPPMSDREADQLRCLAHDIIIKLMNAGRLNALALLEQHAKSAINKVNEIRTELARKLPA